MSLNSASNKSLFIAAVLLAACQQSATVRDGPHAAPSNQMAPVWSLEQATIVFEERSEEASEIYMLDLASGARTRITSAGRNGARAVKALLTRDGSRIAYQHILDGNYEIHVMDIAGGYSANITNHPEYDVLPSWSPDGERIAFMSTRGFTPGGIGPFPGHVYTARPDGDELRQVTREPLTSSLGPSDWSGDGKHLLMARVHGKRPDLYLLDVASGEETRLTDTPEGEYSAAFSHDGRRIAFHAETESESQIAVMNRDGSARRMLTSGPGFNYGPRWSPDDSWILYTGSEDGEQYDVLAVEVASGRILKLVASQLDERANDWMPAPAH